MRPMLHRLFVIGLMMAALPTLAVAQASPVIPTPEMIMALKIVGDPQIDREGRWIAYTVGTPRSHGKRPLSRLWRVPATGKEVAREIPAPEGANEEHPRWSADGRTLYFISNRPSSAADDPKKMADAQVWRVDANGENPTLLTHSPGDVTAFDVTRDGTRIAYLAADAPDAAAVAAHEAKDDAVLVDHPTRFSRVWLRNLSGGETRALTAPDLQVHDLAWSPDGRSLAMRVSRGTTLNDYWYRSRVVLVDADTGELAKELEAHASAHPLQWSPDGTRLLYGHLGEYGMVADVTVHDFGRDRKTVLAPGWNGTLWLARWQDDRSLLGLGQRGVRGAFLRLDATTGQGREVARPQVPFASFTTTATGRSAYLGIRDDQPTEVWTLEGGRLAARTDTHPQVAGWAHGQVRELAWTSSRDGLNITGLLVTPPGWKRGTPLPTLVQGHGVRHGPGGRAGWAPGMTGHNCWRPAATRCSCPIHAVRKAAAMPSPKWRAATGAEGISRTSSMAWTCWKRKASSTRSDWPSVAGATAATWRRGRSRRAIASAPRSSARASSTSASWRSPPILPITCRVISGIR